MKSMTLMNNEDTNNHVHRIVSYTWDLDASLGNSFNDVMKQNE